MCCFHARFALAVAVAIGLLVVGATEPGHAQFVPYDGFDSGAIDPGKWSGFSIEGPRSSPTTEFARAIDSGQLRLSLTSHGDIAAQPGLSDVSMQGVRLRKLGAPGAAGSIIGIQADITVVATETGKCGVGGSTESAVELLAMFFNDGSSTGPDDRTGDISVRFRMLRWISGVTAFWTAMQRCPDASCDAPVTLLGCGSKSGRCESPVIFTMWELNAPVNVKVAWQQAKRTVKLALDGVVTTQPLSGTRQVRWLSYPVALTDAGPPRTDVKQIAVTNQVENCPVARQKASIDARIDNVYVRRQP